jgi:predicted acylesterase/phospholipase RssA
VLNVLEQAGIRFLGIGGTSAGSINALLLAALGQPADRKSDKLLPLLADIPNRVPLAPTFGAQIGIDRAEPATIGTPAQLLGAVFTAAQHTLDNDFIRQNPDYRHLVTMIDTGSHHWLNFTMSDDDKVDLFVRGAKAAAAFLCRFDWLAYKEIRKGIAEACLASDRGIA